MKKRRGIRPSLSSLGRVVHPDEAGAARNNEKALYGRLGVGAVVPLAAPARHPKNSFLRRKIGPQIGG